MLHDIVAGPEFWVMIAFVVVVAGVAIKGWPAIAEILDQRAQKIGQDLDEAQRLREDAQQALAEYQRKQRDSLNEAEAIMAHARAEAERTAERAERELEATLERRRKMASEKIALDEANAIAAVRTAAVEIAIAAVRSTLGTQLAPALRTRILDDAIEGLPQALN